MNRNNKDADDFARRVLEYEEQHGDGDPRSFMRGLVIAMILSIPIWIVISIAAARYLF